MAKMNKIKDRSGYFVIASGIAFAVSAQISSQPLFYVLSAILIVAGLIDLKISNNAES